MASSSDDKHQTQSDDTSNQPKDGGSTSGHPVVQAQQHEMIVGQPSNGLEIQENIRSPSPSSPTRIPSQEELENEMNDYSSKIRGYELKRSQDKMKMKEEASSDKRQKRISNQHVNKVLDEILETEQCPTKGFVKALVDKDNIPVSGSSDSLRAWWKESVKFDKAGPAQIEQYYKCTSLSSNVAHDSKGKSTTELLMELSDPTLGSILSFLMQHSNPPKKNFQYKKDSIPQWWPTGREQWWGQTGIPISEGPPPFKRPHSLNKKWKVVVILGIIKVMSPHFSKIQNLMKEAGNLLSRMNAREIRFWTLALLAEAKLYSQEHHGMPSDEVVAFLLAHGSSASRVAPLAPPRSNTMSSEQAVDIEAPRVPSGGTQDFPADTILFQVPYLEQPGGGPSTEETQDVQNQEPEFDVELSSSNQDSANRRLWMF